MTAITRKTLFSFIIQQTGTGEPNVTILANPENWKFTPFTRQGVGSYASTLEEGYLDNRNHYIEVKYPRGGFVVVTYSNEDTAVLQIGTSGDGGTSEDDILQDCVISISEY